MKYHWHICGNVLLVPITLLILWARFKTAHDMLLLALHWVTSDLISAICALCLNTIICDGQLQQQEPGIFGMWIDSMSAF